MADINLLKQVWKELGPFNLDSLNNRIIFQKTIYLLQKIGLDSKYKFSWYLYGPYSSELASHGFNLSKKGNIEVQGPALNAETINKFKTLTKGKGKDSVWYELVASILFLSENNSSKETIFTKIKGHRTYLNNQTSFETAWNKLAELSLINQA